jgi:GAF domain-containing protein
MEDATAQPTAGPAKAARRRRPRLGNKVQAALLKLAQQAITSPDIEEVLTELARQAKKFLKTDIASLVLIEDDGRVRPIFDSGSTPDGLVILADAILAGKGLTGQAYQTGQLLATDDYVNDPRFEHHPVVDEQARQNGLAASLAAPVLGQDKKVVALLWLGKFRPYHWKETDFLQAQQFAEMAGLVITSYHTYQDLSSTNRELTLRNQQLETLHKFVQGLHSAEDFKVTAERGLRLALEAAQAESGTIHLLEEPDAGELVLTMQAGLIHPSRRDKVPEWLEKIKLGSGLSGRAAQTRQTLVINDLPEFYRQNPDLPLNPNPIWQTMLFIPLVALDQLIGLLTLASRQKALFSSEQVRFAESIAAQLALVLYQTLQLERQKLLAVQALANTAAHDLIQQLAVIQALLDLSLKLGQPVDNETLHIMQEAVTSMTNQVREYRRIVRVEITEPVPGITMLDRTKSLRPEEES